MTGFSYGIDFYESGEGPTIVFVPGSCSTGAAWRPVIAALSGGFRCVTTSLPGYGETAERRSPLDPPMVCEVEVVEAVVRRAAGLSNEPVHLVGHSFGGLTMPLFAACFPDEVAGVVLIDPVAPSEWDRPSAQEQKLTCIGATVCRRAALLARLGAL